MLLSQNKGMRAFQKALFQRNCHRHNALRTTLMLGVFESTDKVG